MDGNEANPQQDFDFKFTVANNQVTGVQVIWGSQSVDLNVPSNATFSIGTNTITETLTGADSAKVITYSQDAGSTTLYDKTDVTTTFNHPSTSESGFSFTITNGAVTSEQHIETQSGQTESVHIPLDAVFTIGTGSITEQVVKGNEVYTVTYTQPSGSSLYAVSSIEKGFVDGDSSTTQLDVNPQHRFEFTFDSSGNVTQAEHLDPQGALHLVSNPHVSFTELAAGYVEKVVTYGSATAYTVYYEGQAGNGIYTEVAHGSGATVDLAGLQAQVTDAQHLLASTPSTSTGWVI